jgi:hypothetical protein
MNVEPLNIKKVEPNQLLIDFLMEALAKAEAGDLIEGIFVGSLAGGHIYSGFATIDSIRLVGELAKMQHDLLTNLHENARRA